MGREFVAWQVWCSVRRRDCVGALGVAFAEQLPAVTATGTDVSERFWSRPAPPEPQAGVADRVQLRWQDVAALTERDRYDLVWLPAPSYRRPRCTPVCDAPPPPRSLFEIGPGRGEGVIATC